MRRVWMVGLLCCTVLISKEANAQGEYLEKGTNAFAVMGGLRWDEDERVMGVAVGYSINGIFDLGISVTRASQEGEFDLKVTELSPSITVHAIKATKQVPFSFAVKGAYSKASFSGDDLDRLGLHLSGSSYLLAGLLYATLPLSAHVDAVPTVSLSYLSVEVEGEAYYLGERFFQREQDEIIFVELGIGLCFDLVDENVFVLKPAIIIDDNDNLSYGFSVGLVFPVKTLEPSGSTK